LGVIDVLFSSLFFFVVLRVVVFVEGTVSDADATLDKSWTIRNLDDVSRSFTVVVVTLVWAEDDAESKPFVKIVMDGEAEVGLPLIVVEPPSSMSKDDVLLVVVVGDIERNIWLFWCCCFRLRFLLSAGENATTTTT
jgi:hypothetical protein